MRSNVGSNKVWADKLSRYTVYVENIGYVLYSVVTNRFKRSDKPREHQIRETMSWDRKKASKQRLKILFRYIIHLNYIFFLFLTHKLYRLCHCHGWISHKQTRKNNQDNDDFFSVPFFICYNLKQHKKINIFVFFSIKSE